MSTQPPYRQLRRSTQNRMLFGVCAGLAEYFNIDPTIVRLIFVFGVILGWGLPIPAYIVLFLVVPEDAPPPVVPPSD